MIILGIDPSTVATGYSVMEIEDPGDHFSPLVFSPTVIEYGAIKTKRSNRMSDRITKIYDNLEDLIEKYEPDIVVSEDQYGGRVNAVKALSHVRGAIMVLCSKRELPLYLLAPSRVKKTMTGKGNCNKQKVIEHVSSKFGIDEDDLTSDMADAIAIAYTYLFFEDDKLRTA